MSGGVAEVKYDVDPLVEGVYLGANGSLTVRQTGADFKSCGVFPGLAVLNLTDGSSGLVTYADENSFTATLSGGTNNCFNSGDKYAVYMTPQEGSLISVDYTDRRYGHKVLNPNELVNGIKANELDVDENERNVFGPGEPWRDPRGL
jgi:hypothetical protein